MQTIRIVFTRRNWNPVSIAIRAMVPASRLAMALASHCVIVDGDHAIEASMIHGVRRIPLVDAMKGCEIVATVDYEVPDAEAGLAWARGEAGRNAPYDFGGAFGLLTSGRDWQDPIAWFCFELAAMAIEKSGRRLFRNVAHVGGGTLLAIEPSH